MGWLVGVPVETISRKTLAKCCGYALDVWNVRALLETVGMPCRRCVVVEAAAKIHCLPSHPSYVQSSSVSKILMILPSASAEVCTCLCVMSFLFDNPPIFQNWRAGVTPVSAGTSRLPPLDQGPDVPLMCSQAGTAFMCKRVRQFLVRDPLRFSMNSIGGESK